jgi:hypothetical protein
MAHNISDIPDPQSCEDLLKLQRFLQTRFPDNVLMPSKDKRPVFKHKNGEYTWDKWINNGFPSVLSGTNGISGAIIRLTKGIVVIDIDNKDHLKALEDLQIGFEETVVCNTKKGRHYWFLRTPACDEARMHDIAPGFKTIIDKGTASTPLESWFANFTEKIPVDIKTTARTTENAPGVLSIPPSTGKVWLRPPWLYPMLPLPQAFIDHFIQYGEVCRGKENTTTQPRNKNKSNKKNDGVFPTTVTADCSDHGFVPLSLLTTVVLELIDKRKAEDYDSWLKVLFAINNTCHFSGHSIQEKNKLAHAFSKRSTSKYSAASVDEKLSCISHSNNGVHFGTLAAWAKQDSPIEWDRVKTQLKKLPEEIAFQPTTKATFFGAVWYSGQDALPIMRTNVATLHAPTPVVELLYTLNETEHYTYFTSWDSVQACISQAPDGSICEIVTNGRRCKPYIVFKGKTFPHGVTTLDEFHARCEKAVTHVFNKEYNIKLTSSDFVWLQNGLYPAVNTRLVIATQSPPCTFHSNIYTDPQSAFHLATRVRNFDQNGLGTLVDLSVYVPDVCLPIYSPATAAAQNVFVSCLRWAQVINVPVIMPENVKGQGLLSIFEASYTNDKAYTDLVVARMLALLKPLLGNNVHHISDFTFGMYHSELIVTCNVNDGGYIHADGPVNRLIGHIHPDPNCPGIATAAHVKMQFLERNPDLLATPDLPASLDNHRDAFVFNKTIDKWKGGQFQVLSIRSPMGTGKSTMLDTLLQEFQGASILFVTYRQTLAYEQKRQLRRFGFTNYLDTTDSLDDRLQYPRLIVQIESLHRLCSSPTAYPTGFDIVVIDEVESVLRHFASKTIDCPSSTMDSLISLLEQASHVLTMDAFWGALSHEFLDKVAITNQLIVNTHRQNKRTFACSNDVGVWTSKLITDLKHGKNIVLVSLSVEIIHKIRVWILKANILCEDDMLIHTSKTGDEVKRQLIDVNSLWNKFRFVAYSPTISAGVDFNREHFDTMYMYCCSMSSPPLGAMQMTGRVRKLKNQVIECCLANNMSFSTSNFARSRVTPQEQLQFLTWMDTKFKTLYMKYTNISKQAVSGCNVFHRLPECTPLMTVLSYAKAEEHNASFQFFKGFADLAEMAGHEVVVVRKMVKGSKIPKNEHNTPYARQMLIGARDMSTDEYGDVQKLVLSNNATENDKWDVYKYEYKRNAGIDKVSDEFMDVYGTRLTCPKLLMLTRVLLPLNSFWHTDTKHSDNNSDDIENIDVNVELKGAALRATLVTEVLEALGMKSPFDTETVIPDLMQLWTSTIKHTKMFRNYAEYKSLFNSCRPSKCDWDLNSIVKAVNMVLGSAGIAIAKLKREQKVINGIWVSTYKYSLDKEKVQLMMELFKMKSIRFNLVSTNQHANERIESYQLRLFGDLVSATQSDGVCMFVDADDEDYDTYE